ncbi:esterase/lipase family protein [Corynebacterium pseudopelargi]|uniref:esterase/lipase family protein n=1 Tax=Corynebacterium pseudopelargi TaxID=2080757 RepID=UPI0013DDA588|nr:alpha/beta fold hydrolase [Corynebacterium pseudopelargi]
MLHPSVASAQNAEAEVAAWTGMDAPMAASKTLPGAALRASTSPYASPMGANHDCETTSDEPPVVLIHGMTSNSYASFGAIAPALAAQGKCVFALNYGYYGTDAVAGSSVAGSLPGFFGLGPMQASLEEINGQVAQIKAHTGAEKVDLVGWSEGGALAAAYAKQDKGDVRTVVSIAGVLRGTTVLGISNLLARGDAMGMDTGRVISAGLGPAGNDLLEESAFMTALKEGGIEVPGVRYVAISTLYDEAATPLSATQFNGGEYRNIVVQHECPQDRVDHLGMPYDPRTIAFVAEALGVPVTVPCVKNVGPAAGLRQPA